MKLDENWLIYRFYINLGNKNSGYFEKYSQEHDIFNNERNKKHTLRFALQHFQNIIYNPSTVNKSIISMRAPPDTLFICPN